MTLQQLMYFKEVAKKKNFTKAAETMYTSQSSLSHAIKSLENDLGVPLFIRNSGGGRSIELTRYGECFLPDVTQAINILNESKKKLVKLRNPFAGELNIVYSMLAGPNIYMKLLNAFKKNEMHDESIANFKYIKSWNKAMSFLASGEDDFFINSVNDDNATKKDELELIKIADQQLYVYVNVDNPLSKRRELLLTDIKDESLSLCPQYNYYFGYVMQMFDQYGLNPNLIKISTEWLTTLQMIAMNQCITVAPELPYTLENVIKIKLNDPMATRDVHISWLHYKKLSPLAEEFKAFCREYFKDPEHVLLA